MLPIHDLHPEGHWPDNALPGRTNSAQRTFRQQRKASMTASAIGKAVQIRGMGPVKTTQLESATRR
jgi:hypothetical protein